MGSISYINRKGDTLVTYPTVTPGMTLNAEQTLAVQEAERVINDARQRGATVFAKVDGTGTRVTAFDPHVDEYVIAPPMAGG